jgi:putative zinc finger/helix-turn-helix YgiT family protein
MRCPACQSPRTRRITRPYHYTECGLSYVYLTGVTYMHCEACKDDVVEIPREQELLERLAQFLIGQPYRLGGKEIRFLRSTVGWSQEELARRIGVKRLTVTRWEADKNTPDLSMDVLLRIVWLNGFGTQYRQEHRGQLTHVQRALLGRLLATLVSVTDRIKDRGCPKLTYDVKRGRFLKAA